MKNKLLLLLLLIIIPAMIFSQEKTQDIVHLKDGRTVKGIIIKNVEGEFIRLKVPTHTMTIYYEDIESINKEEYEVEVVEKQDFNPVKDDAYFVKNKNEYWSLATGLGQSYGGMIGLRFQQRFGEKMGLGYHGGIGYTPGGDTLRGFVGFAVGVKFFFYKSYYINLQYGTAGLIYYEDVYGNILNQEIMYGPAVMAGGDWFFTKYFGMNGALGVAFNVSHPDVQSAIFKLDIGLMVKFK